MATAKFPKSIPLHEGTRARGWIFSEVMRWVSERIEEGKKLRAEAEEAEQDKIPEQQEEDEEAEEIAE